MKIKTMTRMALLSAIALTIIPRGLPISPLFFA